jgi:endoribonuclease Dicer
MTNKKNAKRAAALEACIQLHKCGELDNNLLPLKKEFNEEDVSYLFEHWPSEREPEAGNKKKKRLYDREIAACVQGEIQENQTLYLHVIKLNPLYKRQDDFNRTGKSPALNPAAETGRREMCVREGPSSRDRATRPSPS